MINKGMMSSNSNEWATPQKLYSDLNQEFHFNLDPCATSENAKCSKYFTKELDGLKQSWADHTIFCNPPYGRQLKKWVKKAYDESRNGSLVVMLIPARTDTSYFHDYIYGKAEIRFLRGRLYFNDGVGRTPFPSMIVIFKGVKP